MKTKPTRRRRRSAAEIQALLQRYNQSQATQAEFAQREGICVATLARYRKAEATRSAAGFVEIEREQSSLGAWAPEPFRVHLSAQVSLEIHPGFCAGEVARLLALLAGLR